MKNFIFFNTQKLQSIINHRELEKKIGEKIKCIDENQNIDDFLEKTSAQFIIYGIEESIGVFANFGRIGTECAFNEIVKSLVNTQNNYWCKGSWMTILGSFQFPEYQKELQLLNINDEADKRLVQQWVSEIDKQVTFLNSKIIQAGKIPIVIGGGHNNAYGNIKGLSLGKNQAINVVNFDAHTDFRPLEGRHSGNGFSYAFDEDFLDRYYIFGIHENYTSKKVLKNLQAFENRILYVTYEAIEIRSEKNFDLELKHAKDYIKGKPYGVEIDLDAIIGTASSAISPSGFTVTQARKFTYAMGSHSQASYLHICEGAPLLDSSTPSLIGKLGAYLITDFIKAKKA